MNRRIETKLTNKSINPILELTGVGIEFPTPKGPFKALTDVNLKIAKGWGGVDKLNQCTFQPTFNQLDSGSRNVNQLWTVLVFIL